jgi:hypothetical protein
LINFGIARWYLRIRLITTQFKKVINWFAANGLSSFEQGKPIMLKNERTGASIECVCTLSDRQKAILTAGGMLNYIRANKRRLWHKEE